MAYFSSPARKLKKRDDEDDDEVARPNPILPEPRRLTLVDTPPPPMPITPIVAPPTRVNLDALGPAPGTEEYAINQMEGVAKNLRDYMATGDYSNATIGPDGNIIGARFPVRAPAIPEPRMTSVTPTGVPEPPPMAGPLDTAPKRVFVGEDYRQMNPTQRAAARLRVLQGAAPESKVTDTGSSYEVAPPEKMGRAAGAGRGFLTLMGAGADRGVGGMMGSGLFGAILGAIAPGRIQKMLRARELHQAQGEYANQLGLDEAQLQNESRRIANLRSVAELQNQEDDRDLKMSQEQRVEWNQGLSNISEMQKQQTLLDPKSAEYAAASKAIQQEAERLSKKTGRTVTVIPGNPKLNQLPRLQSDGQIIQQQYDGTWKPVYGTPTSEVTADNADQEAIYKWQRDNAENEAKRTAANSAAADLIAAAEDHQRKVTTIAGQISNLDAQMAKIGKRDPALGPLQRQRQQLKEAQETEQKAMDESYRKAREHQSEAMKYPTLLPPPKRVRRNSQQGTATPAGQSLSKSAWLQSHPGGDWNAAVTEAQKRNIPIIP